MALNILLDLLYFSLYKGEVLAPLFMVPLVCVILMVHMNLSCRNIKICILQFDFKLFKDLIFFTWVAGKGNPKFYSLHEGHSFKDDTFTF